MPPAGETLSESNHNTNHEASAQNEDAGGEYPAFDPDNARRLQDETRGGHWGEAEDTAERLGHGLIALRIAGKPCSAISGGSRGVSAVCDAAGISYL